MDSPISGVANVRRHRTAFVFVLMLIACAFVAQRADTASAAVSCAVPTPGTPAISVTKNQPAEALYGQNVPVTLTAAQQSSPPGVPESGFNLSFRDVLEPGVSYAGGAPVAPTVIADQPAVGYTTLIFSNVADLAPGSDFALSYNVSYDTAQFAVGDTITTGTAAAPQAVGAYVNCNPRRIPRFDEAGLPVGNPLNSASSSAFDAPRSTLLIAVQIEKSEPSPEHELLRGIHNQKTSYTLTARNNLENPSDNLTIVDYIPAGMEFLGCNTTDNTTDAPSNPLIGDPDEYPGSGPLTSGSSPALSNCVTPDSVEFGFYVPGGPGSAGNYTRVEWDLGPAGDLTPGATYAIDYAAGVPICPNTNTWSNGSAPTAASLLQTSNLNNNSCAGGETVQGTPLTNYAGVTADYDPGTGPVTVTDDTSLTVRAMDLAIWKESLSPSYAVGSPIRWALHVRTSEYRTFANPTITDVAPNGTCPVVGNPPPASPSSDPECAPTGSAADDPVPAWQSAVENPDGTWNIDWSLPAMDHDEETVVEFSTMVREYYQSGFVDSTPVLSGDRLENNVDVFGAADPICSDLSGIIPCVGGTPPYITHTQPPGTVLTDDSSASVGTGTPSLSKQVANPVSLGDPADCTEGANATYHAGTQGLYRPGDIVCWKLRVDFPGTVSTGGVQLTDFLPRGFEYAPGVPGTGLTGNSTLTLTSVDDEGTYVNFNLDVPDDTVDPGAFVFEYILATTVTNAADLPNVELPAERANMLKMTSVNTAGQVTTYRDEATAEIAEPDISLTKGVEAVNGNSGVTGKPDNVTVVGGDDVTFNVDVENASEIAAFNAVVEEVLPSPYTCANLNDYANVGIADSATCVNLGGGGARLTWTGVDIPAAVGVTPGSTTLTFDFTVSDDSSPFTAIPDSACVYSYDNETNQAFPDDFFTHYPDNSLNARCTPPPLATVTPPANDDSQVIGGGTFVKSQTTSVDETNNNLLTQATIGETVTYTIDFGLPQHMSVTNMTVTDAIPTGMTYVAGSLLGQLDGGALPGGMSAVTTGSPTVTGTQLNIGTHTNTTNAVQHFTLTFQAQVTAGSHGNIRSNTALRSFTDQFGVVSSNVSSNTTDTTIVEPNPAISKNEDDADDIVSPGQEIQYTLTVTNPNRTGSPTPAGSPPLHDTVITDVVPVGLTPTDGNGVPLADGAAVRLCNNTASTPTGTWNDATNTITWNLGTVAPATSTALRYCVQVDSAPSPAGGQRLTNNAALVGTSMNGVIPGERTYNRAASDFVTVAGSTSTKSVSDTTPTIGQTITYTVTALIPANTQFYGLRIVDDMPTGFDNIQFTGYSCSAGCPPGVQPAAPTTSIGVGDILTWDFGNITADTTARTLSMTYTARVDNVAGNQSGTPLTNTAGPTWCTVVTTPCPPANVITPTPATQTVTLTEPNLTIDKDVSCQTGDADACNVQPQSGAANTYTYSITIDNDGNETAYDAIVQDAIPAGLTNVTINPLPAGVTAVTPSVGYDYAFQIASLTPSDTPITITYTADLAPSSDFDNLDTVTNTARITEYWGLNLADRTGDPDAREYPEGAEPEDSVTLTVHVPLPELDKTVANAGNAEINQPLQWTLTIGNNSPVATLNDIDVTDVLPTGWVYDAGSTTLDAAPYADPSIGGQTLSWTNVGDIAGGGPDKVLRFTAHPTMASLTAGNPTNPYINGASIAGEDNSGATGHGTPDVPYTAADTANANIQMPNLSIAKTPDLGSVTAGTWNNFTITVTNSGPGTARDLVLVDDIPTGLDFDFTTHDATAVCSPLACDNFQRTSGANSGSGAAEIDWQLDSLPSGGSITITLPLFVPASTVSGASFTNTAGTSSTERPTTITDNGSWNVVRDADLAITKVGAPDPGTAGENITYTLTVNNNGPSDASGITVTDDIDLAQFSFVSVTPTDTVNDSCSTTGAPTDHIECTVGGVMAPGAPARTFTVVLQVRSGLTGNVTNTATVDGNEPDSNPGNNTSTEVIPLDTLSGLSITKDVSTSEPSTILNHDETEFTIVVTNNGPSDALNVTVTDDVPAGLSCQSTTPASAGCSGTPGGDVTWSLGTIVAGDSVTLTMTVRGELVGAQLNVATVSSPTDPTDDSDDATVTVDPMADLEMEKTGPPSGNVDSGADFDYTLRITNNGPDPAVTPEVTDTLPAGLTYVSHAFAVGTGTCTITGQQFDCDLPTMASGDVVEITLTVNSGYGLSDTDVTNTAHVESPVTPDTIPANNTDDTTVHVGPNADVAIVKSGPAFGAEGYPLTYTLSVVNNGPAQADDVLVTDPLPTGLTYQSATSTVGTCTEAGGTVECDLGDMAVGATAQITIVSVPQASLIGTTITNTASVGSITPDPDTSNNSSSVNTPIENNAYPTSSNVTIAKTPSNATPKIGDTITYALVVSNSGPDTARGVSITDTLPTGLIYVSAAGPGSTCSYKAPVVGCTLPDIPSGGSVTVTLTAIVADTGTIVNIASVTAANDREPGDNTATSPIVAGAATAKLQITKVASKQTVKVGQSVTYTIRVKNVSKTTAVRVQVCDLIPARLTVVRRDGGELVRGNLCWDITTLGPGSVRKFKPKFRVTNGNGSRVTNPVRVTSENAATKRAKASIRVPQRASRGGGTTG